MQDYISHAAAMLKNVDINTFVFTHQFEIVTDFVKLLTKTFAKGPKPFEDQSRAQLANQVLFHLRGLVVMYLVELDIPENSKKINVLRRARTVLNYYSLKKVLDTHILALFDDFLADEYPIPEAVIKEVRSLRQEILNLDGMEELGEIANREFQSMIDLFPTEQRLTSLPADYEDLIAHNYKPALKDANPNLEEKLVKVKSYSFVMEDLIFQQLPSVSQDRITLTDGHHKLRNGRFGDIYAGKLDGKRCCLHVLPKSVVDDLPNAGRIYYLYLVQEMTSLSFRISNTGMLTLRGIRFSNQNVTALYEQVVGFLPDILSAGATSHQVLAIFKEVAAALETIHRLFFFHGDINPKNIVITPNLNYGRQKMFAGSRRTSLKQSIRSIGLVNRDSVNSQNVYLTDEDEGKDNARFRVKLANLNVVKSLQRHVSVDYTEKLFFEKVNWKQLIYIAPEFYQDPAKRLKEVACPVDVYGFGITLLESLIACQTGAGKVKKPFRKIVAKIKSEIIKEDKDKEKENNVESDDEETEVTTKRGIRLNKKLIESITSGKKPKLTSLRKSKDPILSQLTNIVERAWANNVFERCTATCLVTDINQIFQNLEKDHHVEKTVGSRPTSEYNIYNCTESLNTLTERYDSNEGLLSPKALSPGEKLINPDGLSLGEISFIVRQFLEKNDPKAEPQTELIARQLVLVPMWKASETFQKKYGVGLFDSDINSKAQSMNLASMNLSIKNMPTSSNFRLPPVEVKRNPKKKERSINLDPLMMGDLPKLPPRPRKKKPVVEATPLRKPRNNKGLATEKNGKKKRTKSKQRSNSKARSPLTDMAKKPVNEISYFSPNIAPAEGDTGELWNFSPGPSQVGTPGFDYTKKEKLGKPGHKEIITNHLKGLIPLKIGGKKKKKPTMGVSGVSKSTYESSSGV